MGPTSELFFESAYSAETVALLTAVFNDAWTELTVPGKPDPDMRQLIANRMMRAVARGERDPGKLKQIALGMAGLTSA